MEASQEDHTLHTLPDHVKPYRELGPFTADTIPRGLFSNHSTKAGVWGQVTVHSGSVRYVITEPGEEESILLDADTPGIVCPQQRHHLELKGPVELGITFLK